MQSIAQQDTGTNVIFIEAFRDLRARWPMADIDTVLDAAAQVAADAANVADEVDAKPGIGFDGLDEETEAEWSMDDFESMWHDARACDEAQGGYSDWRWA